jgi:magnesium chelatase family protein
MPCNGAGTPDREARVAVAIVHSRGLSGVSAPRVSVEVHLAGGLPGVQIVGLA